MAAEANLKAVLDMKGHYLDLIKLVWQNNEKNHRWKNEEKKGIEVCHGPYFKSNRGDLGGFITHVITQSLSMIWVGVWLYYKLGLVGL